MIPGIIAAQRVTHAAAPLALGRIYGGVEHELGAVRQHLQPQRRCVHQAAKPGNPSGQLGAQGVAFGSEFVVV